MKASDAAALLAIAARFDSRKVTDDAAHEWAGVLGNLDPDDCAAAIREHFANSTDYLLPAHVRSGVKRIRADRLRCANSGLFEPHNVDPGNVVAYLAAQRERRNRIANGQTVDAPPEIEGPKREVRKLMDDTIAALPKIPTDLERLS